MEEHVLAHDQRVIVADFLKREKIVALKDDALPNLVDHAKASRLAVGFEVLFEDALRQPRQFVVRIQRPPR